MTRVTFEPDLCGQTNMARDRMLLQSGKGARVYTWAEPWVTLGCFQRVSEALRLDCSVSWSSRPTGGRAVLHGHDVTLGLALPRRDLLGVRRIYPMVVGVIVDALRLCGADAHLGRDLVGESTSVKTADCFAAVSPNDIVNGLGQKVCGCALRLTEASVLVQASIPTSPPRVAPALVYRHPAAVTTITVEAADFALALNEVLDKKNWELGNASLPVLSS